MRRYATRGWRWVVGHREISAEGWLLIRWRYPVGDSTSGGGSGGANPKTFDFTSERIDLPAHIRIVSLDRLDMIDRYKNVTFLVRSRNSRQNRIQN
jgi:hypothetical protein